MPDVQEFPIPSEVVPENRVCVQFTIPDNSTYRQIVLGWMNQLCYQYNWQRDEGKNAVTCANLFKQSRAEMIASLTEGCTGDDMYFRMRINPEDNCTSEAQYEPEGEWVPFMSQCCCDSSTQVIEHRVNPATGQLEISTDGGVTWTLDPESPITVLEQWPAPVPSGVSGTKCDAATNGKQHIEDLIAGSSEWLETAGTILELAVGVCTALLALIAAASAGTLAPAAAALATAIWAAAAAALEIGKTAFDAYWTSAERDKITCALFCTIGDDGAFTEAQYSAFLAKWSADSTPSPAFNLVFSTLKAGGRKGLNNLCSYGSAAEADCSDCNCGTCDFSTWEQWVNGIIIEQDETHIVIQAVFGGGQWNAGIRNANIDSCCCNVQIVAGEGELINAIGYVPCGLTNDDQSNMSFDYTGQLANAFALAATAAFTVTITGNSEGDCI